MIVAYAGSRAHSLTGDSALVSERLRRFVAALQPAAVVGAAADGADLLILEAVLVAAHRAALHIVLPTTRDVFSRDSVEPAWRDRFEAVLDEVAREGTKAPFDVLQTHPCPDTDRRAVAHGLFDVVPRPTLGRVARQDHWTALDAPSRVEPFVRRSSSAHNSRTARHTRAPDYSRRSCGGLSFNAAGLRGTYWQDPRLPILGGLDTDIDEAIVAGERLLD